MKHKPQDMLDKLKTGEDKVAKVKELKAELREAGYGIRATRRKLAAGEKFYFEITIPEDQFWTSGERASVAHLINYYFPEAHVTSGGSDNVTYAEY